MTRILTIPKNLVKKEDLVIIPRSEYEDYLRLKKIIPTVKLNKSEKKSVSEGRKEIKKGKYITITELKNELEY